MSQWAELVDRYAVELKKVRALCGQSLTDPITNTEGLENGQTRRQLDPDATPAVFRTDERPESANFG